MTFEGLGELCHSVEKNKEGGRKVMRKNDGSTGQDDRDSERKRKREGVIIGGFIGESGKFCSKRIMAQNSCKYSDLSRESFSDNKLQLD